MNSSLHAHFEDDGADHTAAVQKMRERRETRKFVFTKSMLRRINDQLNQEEDEEDEDDEEEEDEPEPSESPASHATIRPSTDTNRLLQYQVGEQIIQEGYV
jgi:hypothetical protein